MKRTTLLIVSLSGGIAYLAEAKQAHADAVNFGVYPSVIHIQTISGRISDVPLHLRNMSSDSLTLTSLLQPFTASGNEDGQVRYLKHVPTFFRSIQVLDQGKIVQNLTLAPQQEKTITIRLTVPKSEPENDYYFSLLLLSQGTTPETESGKNQVHAGSSVSGGIATHFLVSVNAPRSQPLQLAEFSTAAYNTGSPIAFTVRVSNQSNHYSLVHGKIEIQNVLGRTEETVLLPEKAVLAHSLRHLVADATAGSKKEVINSQSTPKDYQSESDTLNALQTKHLFPGFYRATLSLTDQNGSSPVGKTIYFSIIPWQLLLAFFAVVIFIILLRKRLNRRVV